MNIYRVAREPMWQEEGWTIPATIEEFANLPFPISMPMRWT